MSNPLIENIVSFIDSSTEMLEDMKNAVVSGGIPPSDHPTLVPLREKLEVIDARIGKAYEAILDRNKEE